jgi:hypothetical protein
MMSMILIVDFYRYVRVEFCRFDGLDEIVCKNDRKWIKLVERYFIYGQFLSFFGVIGNWI